ncbi:hypothetical protein BDV93DRAFT_173696 [Ceratobasidium sp. AG-I]|nr:hypothetical protein BDV93DRAFT_173696 [Ceratobasidium sp. AG-I]
MIRPKPRTNGSGSGFGLGDAGASGSDVGTGKGKAETRKSRSASGSSASSLGAGEAPVIESSASGSGSSSGATVVPVVPSSPYPTGSTSAGPSYASGGSAYPGAQRGYAQAGEGFERSGPSYEQGYGQTTLSFDRSNSAYDPSRSGYSRPGSSYGPANAAGYDRLAPSGYASSPVYPGFEPSSAGYGQTPYAGSSMPSPSHIQPLSSPSHVQVQPLPSPSHVHIPSLPGPSMYGRPVMGGTPVVGSSIHGASPSSHSSYFHSPPGLYPSRSIPISRRPTIVPSLVQHAALGLSLGQPDNSMREPIGRRPSDAGAGPPSMPGGLGFSNAQMEGTGRPGIKQEDGTAGAGMWSNQETQGQLQGRGQEGERFQAGYQDARWAGAGVGSEPAGYNGYQSVSASGMVGSAGGYPYSQQSQQQLYAQQGGSGFGDSQEPYRSMEGGGTYAEGTAPFGMQANVEGNMPKLPHQQFPDYPWPGSERWNHQ